MDIEQTLSDRGKTHGDWHTQAECTNAFKRIMDASPNGDKFTVSQAEALSMIATKLGRICCGDHNEIDHYLDLAGYATLAAKDMK